MQTFRFKADEEKLSAGANRTPTAFVYDKGKRERERESPPTISVMIFLRVVHREPFEQPHTYFVTYFFFSLSSPLPFFFFFFFFLSFFRGNGIFKSFVKACSSGVREVLLDLLASFTARFFSPSNYTHTHSYTHSSIILLKTNAEHFIPRVRYN